MRTCKRCLDPKPDSEFGVNRYYEDERAIYCKECNRKHTAKMRTASRELLRTTRVKVSYAALGMR